MSNAVSTLRLACRNVDKTQNGEIGRAPVAAAQSINVMNEVAKYNKAIAKGAEATASIVNKWADKNKAVNYAVKGVNWATKNVNHLICVSGGLKVAMADDKTTAAINEVAALSTMFAGEGIEKKILPKIVEKLPLNKKMSAIVKGLLFVAASMSSYSLGEVLGKDLSKQVKVNWDFRNGKIDQTA